LSLWHSHFIMWTLAKLGSAAHSATRGRNRQINKTLHPSDQRHHCF
jgi:hypothetical protein